MPVSVVYIWTSPKKTTYLPSKKKQNAPFLSEKKIYVKGEGRNKLTQRSKRKFKRYLHRINKSQTIFDRKSMTPDLLTEKKIEETRRKITPNSRYLAKDMTFVVLTV